MYSRKMQMLITKMRVQRLKTGLRQYATESVIDSVPSRNRLVDMIRLPIMQGLFSTSVWVCLYFFL